jgi:hypothetical protein
VEPCPVCGSQVVSPLTRPTEIAHEFDLQKDFVYSRLHSNPAPEELKDLTDFMHDSASPLLRCASCGLLRRAEAQPENEDSYEADPNDPDVMEQVYPRYLEAFRRKTAAHCESLSPRADILELGPHLGAFLQAAEEWNLRPVGVDVGLDTTSFIRRKGLKVIRGSLEECKLKSKTFEAVFIWNCFEQLPEPGPVVAAVRDLLQDHGLLILRVPNATFYNTFRRQSGFGRKTLAYNNLLGFPYLYGYSITTLNRLMASAGFSLVRGFNSELVTTPFADVPADVAQEQRRVSRSVARWSTLASQKLVTLAGPWIEAVYRKQATPVTQPTRKAIDLRFLERAVA